MKINHVTYLILIVLICNSISVDSKSSNDNRKNMTETQKKQKMKNPSKENSQTTVQDSKIKLSKEINNKTIKMITKNQVRMWAEEISNRIREHEDNVVHRSELVKGFADMKLEIRNGSAIVDKIASVLNDLLERRAQAAETIMRRAEELADEKKPVPSDYVFSASKKLGENKQMVMEVDYYERPLNCTRAQYVNLTSNTHFDANITLEMSSAQVTSEVFDCDPPVLEAMYWSEGLLSTFRHNYAQDASLAFQYFCSTKGFLRHYPGAAWESMTFLQLDEEEVADVYDCRLRPWYVGASGAPRDIVILVDATGSMGNSSNTLIAQQLTLALLSALTDDDYVNVIRFNTKVVSPISCFNDILVPANHVNSAAMMFDMEEYNVRNDTDIEKVLAYAVRLLQDQQENGDHPLACQQAIVLLADSIYVNATQKMKDLDPEGHIRLFVMWLHDEFGLQDNTYEFGEWMTCACDGYFAELITPSAVTQHVLNILRVLERPLVAQTKQRLRVFSDMYAHLEDPRKGEYHWFEKEKAEQLYRYTELRRHKDKLLNESELLRNYLDYLSLERQGHYYEGEDLKYRYQISVSVPVFDHTKLENITIQLAEEKQRNATRQYPVNRLLGVAGVDIPTEHLKLILPYHELGPGGSLFLLDHRGNVVLHENLKPLFDGDILKPGYRTFDVLDLELPGHEHKPRRYPRDWIRFRNAMVLEESSGSRTMYAKHVYENGMRALIGPREYHWRRVHDHYTAVIALPEYGRRKTAQTHHFTTQLANDALAALEDTDFAIHPDWLYCRHVEQYWRPREKEFEYFIRWRRNDTKFVARDLRHHFSPIPPTPYMMPYQCDEGLMSRVCRDAVATANWARGHQEQGIRDCGSCILGSTTAFIATENGLTRWQMYHATSAHAEPPEGSVWSRASNEPWYLRASASPSTLIIHAPVMPVRRKRKSVDKPAPIGPRAEWYTAARTLGQVGVTGFHFHPTHLDDLVDAITNFHCPGEDEDCEAKCDHENWECALIDDAGWILSNGKLEVNKKTEQKPIPEKEGVKKHLATEHPAIMVALLDSNVFKLHWMHDYQAVCFTEENTSKRAASLYSSLVRCVWRATYLLVQLATSIIYSLTLLSVSGTAVAETQAEKDKRRKRLRRDYEREKFERLYDPRVLVNRTKFAACDRSRAVYQLQPQNYTSMKLDREVDVCAWPLVAAHVPNTNLLLIAIFKLCDKEPIRPVQDPLVNIRVSMAAAMDQSELQAMNELRCSRRQRLLPDGPPSPACYQPDMPEVVKSEAERLACWRNRTPLPGRRPNVVCYQHNYTQEEGYRQCGPWLPDPEPEE